MKRSRLISMMFLGLFLVAGISCSAGDSQGPTDLSGIPALEQRDGLLGTNLLATLLSCSPLRPAISSKTIGIRGGTITVGPHTLVIPPGALTKNTVITAEIVLDSVNSVRLLPEGLRFASGKPASLTMSYANCSLVARLLPKKIVYTTERLQLLEILRSVDNILAKKVTAPLEHFSRYAVAY